MLLTAAFSRCRNDEGESAVFVVGLPGSCVGRSSFEDGIGVAFVVVIVAGSTMMGFSAGVAFSLNTPKSPGPTYSTVSDKTAMRVHRL